MSVNSRGNRVIRRGQMFVLPPYTHVWVKCMENTHLISCRIDKSVFVQEYWKHLSLQSGQGEMCLLDIDPSLASCLALIEEYLRVGLDDPEMLTLKLQEFFFILARTYHPKKVAAFLAPCLTDDFKFRDLVLRNYLDVKTVAELASLSHYSLPGFALKFKQCFGESCYRWMSRRKADLMTQEMRLDGSNAKEMAAKYGFSSIQHFHLFMKRNRTPQSLELTETAAKSK